MTIEASERIEDQGGEDIVVVDNIRKTYDTGKVRVEALRGVSMRVRRGEMVTVMGPSGCGKTTLLNCISGLDDLSGGEVYIAGKPLSEMSDRERTSYRASRVGFIFQAYNLLPVLTASENVELPLLLGGMNPREARQRALDALSRVGLEGWKDHKPSELSGGQQQRVAIARSLVNDPEIVFGDEPTGNLDSESSRDIVDLIKQLNRQNGQTFIIVTHDHNVGKMTDRIIMMRDGMVEKEFVPTPF